jgi:hypothetical protein
MRRSGARAGFPERQHVKTTKPGFQGQGQVEGGDDGADDGAPQITPKRSAAPKGGVSWSWLSSPP